MSRFLDSYVRLRRISLRTVVKKNIYDSPVLSIATHELGLFHFGCLIDPDTLCGGMGRSTFGNIEIHQYSKKATECHKA